MGMLRFFLGCGLGMMMAQSVLSHEFWLEPVSYRIDSADMLVATSRNGEDFDGTEYSYSEKSYARSGVMAGDVRVPIPGKSGDRPSVQMRPAGPGLNTVFHQSSTQMITYATMEKFESFLAGKGLTAALEIHAARGFPTEKIREAYFRFARTLVAVGDGDGQDQPAGLAYEWVALDNPYTSKGPVRLQLLRKGMPVEGTQVSVFHKSEEEVTSEKLYTDAEGVVSITDTGGATLVNAVAIEEAGPRLQESHNAVWVTLWASLTFAR